MSSTPPRPTGVAIAPPPVPPRSTTKRPLNLDDPSEAGDQPNQHRPEFFAKMRKLRIAVTEAMKKNTNWEHDRSQCTPNTHEGNPGIKVARLAVSLKDVTVKALLPDPTWHPDSSAQPANQQPAADEKYRDV